MGDSEAFRVVLGLLVCRYVQRILVVNTEQFLSLCVHCWLLGRRRSEERVVKLSGSRGHLNKEKMYESQTGMSTGGNWNISLMALSLPAVG